MPDAATEALNQPEHTDDDRARSAVFIAFSALLQRWRRIAASAVIIAVVAVLVNLFRTPVYDARTTLYQNVEDPSPVGFAMGNSQLGGGLGGLLGRSSGDSKLIDLILNSRSLQDSVASRVGARARATLLTDVKTGAITVQVTDTDPERAARIANTYPGVINEIVSSVTAQKAHQKQEFLRSQLALARSRLENAEQRLVTFETDRGAPGIDEQLSATFNAAMVLEQQITEKEFEISQLRRTATPDNAALQAAIAELDSRKRQLQRLRVSGPRESLFPSLQESPELKASALRLYRELQETQQFYATLAASLAAAQVTASQNLAAVSVLDPARVPTSPTSPGPVIVLVMALVLGLFLSCLVVLVGEALRRGRMHPSYAPFFQTWDRFRRDVANSIGIRRLRRSDP